jgi:hypothetical protein
MPSPPCTRGDAALPGWRPRRRDNTVTTAEPVTAGYLRSGYEDFDGWPSSPTSREFTGTLDDATFDLTALPAAQIAAQYEAGT